MIYTSIDNKKIKELKKLQTKKYRDQTGLFLIEGEHLVEEAYKKGFLKELILEENTSFLLPIETCYVSKTVLKYLSTLETPYSIMGVCTKIEENLKIGERVLVLDGIQDPGNLGTIIRSAVAFHIDTIVLSTDTVDLYNSKVIRATQGLLFHISVIRKDLIFLLSSLKEQNYFLFGTKVTHGKSLKTLEKCQKFAIIMGNEGRGMKKEIESLCDAFLYIAMNPVCESLNVAVATSILLYEFDK